MHGQTPQMSDAGHYTIGHYIEAELEMVEQQIDDFEEDALARPMMVVAERFGWRSRDACPRGRR